MAKNVLLKYVLKYIDINVFSNYFLEMFVYFWIYIYSIYIYFFFCMGALTQIKTARVSSPLKALKLTSDQTTVRAVQIGISH